MKKAIILFVFVGFHAFAQTDSIFNPTAKGRKRLSCDFNIRNKTNSIIDTLSNQKSNDLNLNIGIGFGYFIANNLLIGISPRISYNDFNVNSFRSATNNSMSNTQTTNLSSLSFGLGVYSRYYVDISKQIKFYVTGGASFDIGNSEYKTSSNNIERSRPGTTSSFFANISPGLAFFVSKKVAIEANYGSLYFNTSNNARKNVSFANEDRTTNYGFDFNSFSFGLSYYF